MALVLNATVGGAAANTFATAAEMTTYLEGRLNSSIWTGADAQLPALVEATHELSMQQWIGTTVTSTQALPWPRQYAADPDAPAGGSLIEYATNIIPVRIKHATCELALQFLKAGTVDISGLTVTDGILEKTVDVLTTIYADPRSQKQGLRRYPMVMRFIRPLLVSGSGNTVISVVRG
jgi:hypothetical protein